MRIFTLGKNGITLFYFAFILFSGTYSYGQQVDSCGVTDQNTETAGNQQYFCDSQEAELNNLLVAGETITFYSDAGYTNELNATDLLIGGRTYYIDADGCQSSVTVTIFNQPQILGVEEDALTRRPEASTKQSLGTLGICVADVENPNVFVSDLRTNAPAGSIQWYMSATGTGEPQLIADPATEELQNNTYYYAERLYNDPVDSNLNCATNRARTLVLLTAEAAPEAAPEQEFCASDNPTVGDIVASGDNRYYATATSTVEISQNALLEDGRTYYVSTLGQSCESELRSPVTVALLTADAGEDNTDNVYCQSEIEARLAAGTTPEQLFLELLEPGVPTNGTFADDSIAEISAAFNADPTQTFSTTYTITNELGCEDSVDLSITVTEDRNAGADVDAVFCQSEAEELLAQILANVSDLSEAEEALAEWLGDRETDGTFSGDPLQSILTQYSTNSWPIEVTTTYTVGEGDCADSAEISLTITENIILEEETYNGEICNAGLAESIEDRTDVRILFLNLLEEGAPTDGSFNPSIDDLITQYESNNIGDFTTTYTVGAGDCQDSAELTLTIIEPTPANAGTIANQVVCTGAEEIVLSELLNSEATTGGTFSGTGVTNNSFDPSIGTGDYVITYTVSENEDACITGNANTSFTISVGTGDVTAGSDNSGIVCNAGLAESIEDRTDVRILFLNLLDPGVPTNGTFSPSIATLIEQYEENNIGDFTTTYTVGEGACQGSAELTLTVVEPTEAEAIEISDFSICSDTESINLFTYLNIDPETGEFSNESGVLSGGTLNISSAGNQSITYIVNEDNAFCVTGSDSTTFDVEVIQGVNAGENANITLDTEDEPINLFDVLGGTPDAGGTWSNGDGVFDPSIDSAGSFTYTVSNGTCEDSAVVTVIFSTDPTDPGNGECPEITSSNQSFCPGQATVADLFPTNAVWYSTADATTPLNPETLLEDGEDYFAGNADGTCESRSAVIARLDGQIAGADKNGQVCNAGLDESIDTRNDVRALFINLLDPGVPTNGTFRPSIATIIEQYEANNIGDFTTTYTVSRGECVDSAQLTLTVIEPSEAFAGEDVSLLFCTTDESQNLYDFLTDGANTNGTFVGLENGVFNPSDMNAGEYSFTYIVDDSADCVIEGSEDSAVFTIEVIQGPNAGTDVTIEYCITEIEEMTEAEVLAIFDSLVSEDADEDGTFSPELDTIIASFLANPIGTFETTYTVSNDLCEDSAEITITVNDTVEADAGEDTTITFCATTDEENLFEYLADDANPNGVFEGYANGIFSPSEAGVGTYSLTYVVNASTACVIGEDEATYTIVVVDSIDAGTDNSTEICQAEIDEMLPNVSNVRDLYLSLLGEEVSREGTFNPSIQTLVDRYNSGDQFGDFTTIYTITAGDCEDSVELTVTVQEGEAPNAGDDMTLPFCTTEGAQDLTEYLAAGVNTSGSFEGLEDGIFDPSEMETGEYSYTYTVTTTGECGGTDTATITVILSDSPEAPEVDNAVVFCVSEGATVADLDAERGLNWYSTADLGTPAPADQVLVEGPYFVTQTNEGGCESQATEVTVTLEDTPAPTLTQGGNVFCELDNPTIADLNNNIVETGNITWYDAATGGEAYSSADRLENGVTYYASLTDATSTCESSQRLAVTVNLETCELLIPEAFSPNGDGINDRFEIENLSAEYPNFGMEIYNRWGNKVFTGNSSNSTWDGTSDDGSLGDGVLPVGVYFYILNFNDGQTAPIQGRVYLSR